MRRDENAKDSNVDTCRNNSSTPFKSLNCLSRLGDDADSVDDDLEQQLDLEYPE
jgi:hypothetical protein